MNPEGVRRQIEDLIERLITASVSVKQFFPAVRPAENDSIVIGRKPSTSIALRDVPYDDVYRDLDLNEAYDVKLVDGGLLSFQYRFDQFGRLLQHRLSYFPNPVLPTVDEAPALYEDDELYAEVIARRLVRFPIRFDYAPGQKSELPHPASHLTLGQYENCRIPVLGPLSPNSFGLFIIRNFYCRVYIRHKNTFDRSPHRLRRIETISDSEKRMTHLVHGG